MTLVCCRLTSEHCCVPFMPCFTPTMTAQDHPRRPVNLVCRDRTLWRVPRRCLHPSRRRRDLPRRWLRVRGHHWRHQDLERCRLYPNNHRRRRQDLPRRLWHRRNAVRSSTRRRSKRTLAFAGRFMTTRQGPRVRRRTLLRHPQHRPGGVCLASAAGRPAAIAWWPTRLTPRRLPANRHTYSPTVDHPQRLDDQRGNFSLELQPPRPRLAEPLDRGRGRWQRRSGTAASAVIRWRRRHQLLYCSRPTYNPKAKGIWQNLCVANAFVRWQHKYECRTFPVDIFPPDISPAWIISLTT